MLKPAGRFIAPEARFLWKRITPGGLGIELTTTIAIASVGGFIFAAYANEMAATPRLTPADKEIEDLTIDLQNDTVVEIARVVTDLGSLAVVVPLALIFVALLIWRRRLLEIVVLVSGLLLIYAGVHITKASIDRPRPADPLDDITGSSYPSGHAAYSITYVAMAVVAARVLPGFASRAAVVLGAIVLAAVIGLTRVYLRAHFWSDVVGGWALGAGVFGAVATLALLISYIRQNGAPDGPVEPR